MSDTTRTIVTRIQNKYDSAAEWINNNPILFVGEVGYESDTGKFKIGDGTSAWIDLGYATTLPTEVEDYIKYSNETPIVSALGSIKPGQTFENISIKDMLTMILYPYIDIEVGTLESTLDKQPQVSALPGNYYVHTIPTLNSVTLYVKKNSATNLIFSLWDKTNNKQISKTLTTADLVDNKLTFTDLNTIIDTTREFEIRYSYKGEEDIISKTFSIGVFTIDFLNPSTPTISSNLTSLTYYKGRTANVSRITTDVVNLNSSEVTGGITRIKLYKNEELIKTSNENPSLPYNFYISDTLKDDTTYRVETWYNSRTGNSLTTTETSQSNSINIDFIFQNAIVSLAEIKSNNSISKLEPQNISAGSVKANFRKYSDKITTLKLFANNTLVETNTISGFAGDDYSGTQGTTTFEEYSADNICSKLVLKAEAYNNDNKVATSDEIILDFYAPYCYGFVSEDISFANVDRTVLNNLMSKKSTMTTHIDISSQGYKKFIYAIPNGNYKSAKDSAGNGDENFPLFENSENVANTKKEIEFADGSKVTYQILIFKEATGNNIDLYFRQ